MRVLLVQENQDDALFTQKALAETSLEVVRAKGLCGALEQLTKGGFDVILLDVSLPAEPYGLENVALLQRYEPGVPVVVLTDYDNDDAALKAVEIGAQDCLIKGETDGPLIARALRYAVQRYKAAETLKERNRELLVLRQISQSILGSLDLNWILEKILEQAMVNGSFDIGDIRLLDPSRETLNVVATRGYRDPENAVKHRILAHPTNGPQIFNRVSVHDNVQMENGSPTFRREGVNTFVIVPVRADHEILGLLQLGSRTPRDFRETELHLLETIGSQLGIAVQRARLHEETKNQACALEISSKLQADFTAMIAHDLRSPLLNISGAAEVMLDGVFGSVSEDQKKWLGRIVENSRTMVDLVSDFLDLSKLEAGYIRLNKQPLNLAELVGDTVENYGIAARSKRLSVTHCIRSDGKLIEADARRLAQVLGNLLSNAIKFTEEGGAIEIGVSAKPTELEVWVKDNGIGIPAADIPFLFSKYRQCSNVDESGHKGTGLGLVICKVLVEAHGGKISVRSEEGRGSTFFFSLPKIFCSHPALSAA
jgi:signal transduction histidine kinase/CheY-like chemotaxis protein